jgi:hypothetical protein
MKIKETVKAFFSDPKKDIQAILPQLISLKKEIEKIQNMSNKVEGVVKLFQVISPLQDARAFSKTIISLEKKDYGQLNRQITALTVLRSHINNAGRSEYGWNRTYEGEAVDATKVFLGNIYGIWTKTAAYWLQHQKENEKDFRPDISKNPEKPITTWYIINDTQCGNFIKSHTEGILKQISVLQSAAA